MKKMLFALAAMALLCSCTHEAAHRCIRPLPAGYSAESLTDATVPAAFTSDDFRWMGGNLTMEVYSEDLYDVVDLHQMTTGDTLIYGGDTILVQTIEEKDGWLQVNNGPEEGGADLMPYEGGTYRAFIEDDHSLYTDLGSVELPLDEDFIIIDCGEDPTDPNDTIRTDQKLYLETLTDWRREFNCLNTQVRVENGLITCIQRVWIP